MQQIRIIHPRRRSQRRTDVAPLDAVTGTAETRETDKLLARIEQLLGVT